MQHLLWGTFGNNMRQHFGPCVGGGDSSNWSGSGAGVLLQQIAKIWSSLNFNGLIEKLTLESQMVGFDESASIVYAQGVVHGKRH